MAERYIVVLDAGSSAVRCHVFDKSGRIVATEAGAWAYRPTDDISLYAREFDADATWLRICETISRALHESGASPSEVAAVTATSQRQAVVFLDAAGRELYAGPNLDLRAVFEGGAIDEEMGSRVYTTTGHTPSFLFAPAKLRWFQNNRPDLYSNVVTVLTIADWLVYRLSGVMASEATLAGEVGLLDIAERRWATGLLGELGFVDIGHLPLAQAGSAVGAVAEQASRSTGLSPSTVVATSGADTQCGLLGMGVHDEYEAGVVAGWSVTLQTITGRPVLSSDQRTWAGCFLTPGKWVLESTAGDAGNSYRWLADTVLGGHPSSFEEMDAMASDAPIGSEGVAVFLGPSRMDMAALGLRTGGIVFPVPLTFSDTSRGHLARAALEAIAYAVRANLEQAEAAIGQTLAEVAVGGGMTRTKTWVDILRDVLARPIRVASTPDVSATGAYLCALTAIGEFASLDEVAGSIRYSATVLEPDPRTAGEYADHYQRWATLEKEMRRLPV